MVFLDAPPVGNVTDAAVISTFVEGTILVASSGTVEIDAIKRAKELLSKVNAHIIGVVLNKLDNKSMGNDYYNYYYYYDEESQENPHRQKKHRNKHSEIPLPTDG